MENSYNNHASLWLIAVGILGLLVLVGMFIILFNLPPIPIYTHNNEIASGEVFGQETERAFAAVETQVEEMTSTPTSEPSPTQTPTPTITSTPTPGPALLTPFGSPKLELLVYEVLAGESFELIASRNNTTQAVLRALNVREAPALWVGDIIVVCMGCMEIPDLPPLQPLYLEEGVSLSELAAQYDTPADDLRLWNGLGDADWIEGERWVVVRAER